MDTSECFFKCDKTADLITGGKQRIDKIISSSITRNDDVHIKLRKQLENDSNLQIKFHKSCVSTYTSSFHIKKYLKRVGSNTPLYEPPLPKKRSESSSFDFRQHCLICNQQCLPKDPQHPDRWRRVIVCRTVERKEDLLKVCDERGDKVAAAVRLRIHGAVSDLHAADAQYHYDCYVTFTGKRNIAAASRALKTKDIDPENIAFQYIIDTMQENPARIWNSVELYDVYCNFIHDVHYDPKSTSDTTNIGQSSSDVTARGSSDDRQKRAQLIRRLEEYFGGSIIVLRVNGCASIVCFRKHLPETLTLVEVNDNDEITELAKEIVADVKATCSKNVKTYNVEEFTRVKTEESCNGSLLSFISSLVSKGTVTKKSLSLTQSIQALITKTFNQTTLGLAVKIHHRFGSREIIDLLHEHGYIASYDEVRRYRKSAAKMTGEHDYTFRGILNDKGLISSWCDNFDLQVYTPNGCRETHCMAVELTQNVNDVQGRPSSVIEIPRISKKEMVSLKTNHMSSVKNYQFNGPKKPIPPLVTNNFGLPFDLLCRTLTSLNDALYHDMQWLVSVIDTTNGENPKPEWSGTMAHLARETGKGGGVATQFVFGPLIDSPPSHPDTVLTTLIFIEEFMKQHNMPCVHISADMQIYKVIMQIKWSHPTRWTKLVVRPGGMHTLMSFIGCIGTLMISSGLEELLNAAFKGVCHMLNGKAWPKAVRGLRMVVTALLEPLVLSGNTTVDAMERELQKVRSSRTGRLWVDCLITPVIIIHLYLRAERQGDWLLHMYALKRMIPYFFVAGHWSYARYIAWHTFDMASSLPEPVLTAFLKGEHVCSHQSGFWKSVFLDQFGEQTYIRYGKSKGGLVGKSLSAEQVSEWVLSHHLCNTLSILVDNMYEEEGDDESDSDTGRHKEEGEQRRKLDAEDRKKIMQELKLHTNPLTTLPDEPLTNIINGRIVTDEVNVYNSLAIGERMEAQFMAHLPDGFHAPLKKEVVTMEVLKKKVKVGDSSIYDLERLYARLLVISQSRDIQLSEIFQYELSPIPSALFDDYGDMRKGSKAVLLHKLAVFDTPALGPVDVELVDGNEALYHTLWPRHATLECFAENFIGSFTRSHDTYLIFDSYDKHSIKSHERQRRAKGTVPREYNLKGTTILPVKDDIMKSDENKRTLIQYLCDIDSKNPHLHLIGNKSVYRHEEADVKIISYLLELLPERKHIQILADDTDIFVLLVFFFWLYKPSSQISMKTYSGKVVDINATASKLGNKCFDLLAVHALSGCDTVSYPFGKGKISAVNLLLKSDLNLNIFTDPAADELRWMKAGTDFLSWLYGGKTTKSLSNLRFMLFSKKINPPNIRSLPPTDESAVHHVKRARLQVLIWRAADQTNPPLVDLSNFGWNLENNIPVPVHGSAVIAPPKMLQLVACGCKSQTPCSKNTCSCHSAKLSCTSYCGCRADEHCANDATKRESPVVMDDDDDDDESDDYEV